MIVDNFIYSEYCTLPDDEKEEFATAIRFAKNLHRKDYIGDRDIDEWSFVDVKELMQYAENGDGEGFTKYVIENVQGYDADKLMQSRAYEVLLTFSFITEKIAKSPFSIFFRPGTACGFEELMPDATIVSKLNPSAPASFI